MYEGGVKGRLFNYWCSGGDSNPYTFRHTPLKRTCLPIPPPEQFKQGLSGI